MRTTETLEKSMVKSILIGVPFRDWYGKNGKKYGKSEKYLSNKYSSLKKENADKANEVKNEIVNVVKQEQKKLFEMEAEHWAKIEDHLYKMVFKADNEMAQIKAVDTLAKFHGRFAPTKTDMTVNGNITNLSATERDEKIKALLAKIDKK